MGLLLYKNESDKNLKEINQKYKSKNQPTPPSAPRKCQTHFWGQSRLVSQACQAELSHVNGSNSRVEAASRGRRGPILAQAPAVSEGLWGTGPAAGLAGSGAAPGGEKTLRAHPLPPHLHKAPKHITCTQARRPLTNRPPHPGQHLCQLQPHSCVHRNCCVLWEGYPVGAILIPFRPQPQGRVSLETSSPLKS